MALLTIERRLAPALAHAPKNARSRPRFTAVLKTGNGGYLVRGFESHPRRLVEPNLALRAGSAVTATREAEPAFRP